VDDLDPAFIDQMIAFQGAEADEAEAERKRLERERHRASHGKRR
jgi:hypothetical protein